VGASKLAGQINGSLSDLSYSSRSHAGKKELTAKDAKKGREDREEKFATSTTKGTKVHEVKTTKAALRAAFFNA
jgi:hypothetical protein